MAKIDELRMQLDAEKVKYHQVSNCIQELEQEIALILCPYKVGDIVRFVRHYKSGDKIFEGEIENIFAQYYNPAECFIPIVEKYPLWAISGKKINSDGKKGKHGFQVGPAYFKQDTDGIFIPKTIDEYLS